MSEVTSARFDEREALHLARCADISVSDKPDGARPVKRLAVLAQAEHQIRAIQQWTSIVRTIAESDLEQGATLAANGAFWAYSDHQAWASPHAARLEQAATELVENFIMRPVTEARIKRVDPVAVRNKAIDCLVAVLLIHPPQAGSELEATTVTLTNRLLGGLKALDPKASEIAAAKCRGPYFTQAQVLADFGPWSARPEKSSEILARQLTPGLKAYQEACRF